MQLTTTIPGATVADIVQAIDCILEWHLVVNNFGVYRWQRASCRTGKDELVQYKLEFHSPLSFLWFKAARKNCITVALEKDPIEGSKLAHLRWQIKSVLSDRDFCEQIVRETELEIANVLAESSPGGSRGNDVLMLGKP